MDRPPATRLVGPRGARPRRAVGEYGGDPRRGARAAADRHTHGRAGLGGPRVRGPDGAAPAAGAAHTVWEKVRERSTRPPGGAPPEQSPSLPRGAHALS